MKHVRAVPDPPSARLGRAVSPGLEGLILRCLAKNPKDRPPSTGALADELDRLERCGQWTRADAEEWWASFKETRGDDAQEEVTEVGAGTLTVGQPG